MKDYIQKVNARLIAIVQKLKDKLIDLLGGYTKQDLGVLYKSQVEVRRMIVQAWETAVQEICRRSDNTYYDWCCEYCRTPCNERNGWCEKFYPSIEKTQGGHADERHS